MKIRNTIYVITAAIMAACTADDIDWQLTPEQQDLIGQGVNFSATMTDKFVTRTTYHHDGSFNEGDQMRIFRQYATDESGTTFNAATEIFRTYYYKMNYAAGTISLNNDWLPAYEDLGKLKSDAPGSTSTQTSADSLTWENGRTVRFRAWGRSNLSGCMVSGDTAAARKSFYPDYTVSDWVTVSGPTENIPLTMRHITCRIALVCKGGNEFGSAQVCLEDADYDNTTDADKVRAVYNKMCMPAGVDDATFQLTAMTKQLYGGSATDLYDIEKYTTTDGIVKIGTQKSEYIANNVQHPMFKNNNGNQYLMSIPFDMSSDNAGEALVLPACTRFKVKLYYVKNGTEAQTHTFKLGEITDSLGNQVFKNGLTLKAGYSYSFSVGYQYNKFTVTTTNDFSWTDADLDSGTTTPENQTQSKLDFKWWADSLGTAATRAIAGKSYAPSFKLINQQQFISFIHLVNGTATTYIDGLERGDVQIKENGDTVKVDGFPSYYWKKGDVQMTRAEAEELGYIFYPHFYPSTATQKAYVIEDYVKGPEQFYDAEFNKHYLVELGDDLDMYDWVLPSIGADIKYPFLGRFNGNGNTLYNLNMASGYLFDYVVDGVITNLKIESNHNTCLLNTATSSGTSGWGCYIAGISMLCPSSGSSIAASLKGTSYVVGCIHVGTAGGALVGSINSDYALTMLGCMQAATGLSKSTGALLGGVTEDGSVKWGTFKYNYYDISLSTAAVAISNKSDAYDYDDYIRGAKSHVLKAKHDYMINADADKTKLTAGMLSEIYGLAPWYAMNQGIAAYNATKIGQSYPCTMKYEMTGDGYTNRYPTLN